MNSIERKGHSLIWNLHASRHFWHDCGRFMCKKIFKPSNIAHSKFVLWLIDACIPFSIALDTCQDFRVSVNLLLNNSSIHLPHLQCSWFFHFRYFLPSWIFNDGLFHLISAEWNYDDFSLLLKTENGEIQEWNYKIV